MSENLTLRPIGRIRTEFPEKFGIPRQSGLVEELRAVVEFEREIPLLQNRICKFHRYRQQCLRCLSS